MPVRCLALPDRPDRARRPRRSSAPRLGLDAAGIARALRELAQSRASRRDSEPAATRRGRAGPRGGQRPISRSICPVAHHLSVASARLWVGAFRDISSLLLSLRFGPCSPSRCSQRRPAAELRVLHAHEAEAAQGAPFPLDAGVTLALRRSEGRPARLGEAAPRALGRRERHLRRGRERHEARPRARPADGRAARAAQRRARHRVREAARARARGRGGARPRLRRRRRSPVRARAFAQPHPRARAARAPRPPARRRSSRSRTSCPPSRASPTTPRAATCTRSPPHRASCSS